MEKILFTLQIHSVVDLITNSSSELFVGTNDSKQVLIDLIKNIYPNYLDEYQELKSIDELSVDELEDYIAYHYTYSLHWYDYESGKTVHQTEPPAIIPGFTKEEMFDFETSKHVVYIQDFFVEDEYDRIINNLDPDRKMFFLFSLDDNPDWKMQEQLSEIMTRYHLG